MNTKKIIFTIVLGFMAVLTLGFSTYTAEAQYFNPYFNQLNYSNYTQTCPGGFTISSQGFLLACNNNLGGNIYGTNYNYGVGSVLGASTTLVLGCLPGNMFSALTGQRCDGSNINYSSDSSLRGTNASIEEFNVRDGDDTNIEEGDDDAELMEVRFDVEDGDIRLDRVEFDFEYTGNNNGEDKPWEIFDEIRLMSDGDEIDSINADDEDDWDEEDDDTYSITFTNLNEIIRENDSAKLTIEVDVNSNINGNRGATSWSIFVPDRGIRALTGNGRTVYGGDDDEDVSVDIE